MLRLLKSGSWLSILILSGVVGLWMFLFYALIYNVAMLMK